MTLHSYSDKLLLNIGIYAIVNKVNGKRYIGSTSVSFRKRWTAHLNSLRRGAHHSRHLQRAWNRYAEEDFEFLILETIPRKECVDDLYLTDIEQMWLDTHQPEFNSSPTAASPLGVKHSEDTRKKMSESRKGENHPLWGKTHSEETRRKISKANKGKRHSEVAREKMSESRKGIRPEHFTMEGRSHSEETKNKISIKHQGKILSEETKQKLSVSHKGKVLSEETKLKMSESQKGRVHSEETKAKIAKGQKRKKYIITSPEGLEIITDHLTEFCKIHNLSRGSMSSIANGGMKQHKGWTCRKA